MPARTPLLLLLANGVEERRWLALGSGGSDCIVKPFTPRELVAKVRARLGRFSAPQPLSRLDAADLIIDSLGMKVSVRGIEVPTTSLEFRLIEYLARHRGQVFTRDLLLDAVWGEAKFVTPRSVDACIRRIREKIEPDGTRPTFLKTIRGVGYVLDAAPAWQPTSTEVCDCVACTSAVRASKLAYTGTVRREKTQTEIEFSERFRGRARLPTHWRRRTQRKPRIQLTNI
jgi:DNA-binding winged helix-turn-helix (wHTH) protein